MAPRTSEKCISRFRLRLEREDAFPIPRLRPYRYPGEAAPLLHSLVEGEPFELVGTLLLDPQNRVMGYHIAYQGTLTRVTAEPRGIFLPALMANAASLILFHNHPGGDITPSHDDISTTRQIQQAGSILGIHVWDHLILGEPPLYSSIGETLKIFPAPPPGRVPPMRPARRARPKYRHPKTGQTWAGRGQMARWLREEIEAGAKLEDFRVRE